jgi:glycosyltransferase involved in cell wall biosynthesis
LRRNRIDVIHAFLFDSEIVSRLAAPLARVPVVVSSERNTDYDRPVLHRVALSLTRPMFDVMVANSNAGREFNLRTQGLEPSRVEVVHNGVDTERFRPDREAGRACRARLGIPLEAPVVGMVASYKRHKGQDNFLRMAKLVLESCPSARFMIVGGLVGVPSESQQYRAEVRQFCTSLGLDDHCVFVGNQKDIGAFYNACDVTVLLSQREGTPNTVLESMACGVPVIASDVADNAFVAGHGHSGFIVPVDDAASAATRVRELLASEELRRRFGVAARARVCAEFSLERAAGKLERIYRQCVAAKRKYAARHAATT